MARKAEAVGADRPRLLFLAQTLPYPPHGGVKIRTFHTFRLLAEQFDITAAFFYRWKPGRMEPDVPGALQALGEHARVAAFPIPQEHSRARLIRDHAVSLASARVYTRFVYESKPFREHLDALLHRESFDLVHIDSLDLSGYLPLFPLERLVCSHHNIESELLKRRAAAERNLFRRRYLEFQAELTVKEERHWVPRIRLNLTCSEPERLALLRLAPGASVGVLPNGVDIDEFYPADGAGDGIVFVGGTTWFPNRDALQFFARDVWPHIQAGGPARVRWVGRSTAEEQAEYGAQGLELSGYVPDIRPYVWDAAVFVVPLRVGGGTRLKILDAWAMGKAVVSTSVGCEGLDARDGENILIRDDPRDFAAAVRQLLLDRSLRERLGRAARETTVRQYSWAAIGPPLIARYRQLLQGKPADVRSVSAP